MPCRQALSRTRCGRIRASTVRLLAGPGGRLAVAVGADVEFARLADRPAPSAAVAFAACVDRSGKQQPVRGREVELAVTPAAAQLDGSGGGDEATGAVRFAVLQLSFVAPAGVDQDAGAG